VCVRFELYKVYRLKYKSKFDVLCVKVGFAKGVVKNMPPKVDPSEVKTGILQFSYFKVRRR